MRERGTCKLELRHMTASPIKTSFKELGLRGDTTEDNKEIQGVAVLRPQKQGFGWQYPESIPVSAYYPRTF